MLHAVLGGLSNSIAALIGKVIGKAAAPGVDAKGIKADKADARHGAPLGDPAGHVQGIGYGIEDSKVEGKNVAEEVNVHRFIEAQRENPTPIAKIDREERADVGDKKTETNETKNARDRELHREEQRDENRLQARQETNEQDEREQHEGRDQQRERQRDQDEDDDRHAGTFVTEGRDEEEGQQEEGLRSTASVYNDRDRCKGMLDDETRCLRKAIEGVGYCREHAASWRPGVSFKA